MRQDDPLFRRLRLCPLRGVPRLRAEEHPHLRRLLVRPRRPRRRVADAVRRRRRRPDRHPVLPAAQLAVQKGRGGQRADTLLAEHGQAPRVRHRSVHGQPAQENQLPLSFARRCEDKICKFCSANVHHTRQDKTAILGKISPIFRLWYPIHHFSTHMFMEFAYFHLFPAYFPPKMAPHPCYKLKHGTHLLFFHPHVYGFCLFSAYIPLIFRLFST